MAETLIRLYENSKAPGTCRGCQALIDWFETLNGRKMPMNHNAVPRKSETELSTWRVIAFYAADDSHFVTCPAAAEFSRKAR